jgi:hypothetical protein
MRRIDDPYRDVLHLYVLRRHDGMREVVMSQVVTGENLERAERLISQTYRIVVGPSAVDRVCMKARMDREAVDNFIRHHKDTFVKHYAPDLDPRLDAALNTMFLHMLAVGATAQRVAEGRS